MKEKEFDTTIKSKVEKNYPYDKKLWQAASAQLDSQLGKSKVGIGKWVYYLSGILLIAMLWSVLEVAKTGAEELKPLSHKQGVKTAIGSKLIQEKEGEKAINNSRIDESLSKALNKEKLAKQKETTIQTKRNNNTKSDRTKNRSLKNLLNAKKVKSNDNTMAGKPNTLNLNTQDKGENYNENYQKTQELDRLKAIRMGTQLKKDREQGAKVLENRFPFERVSTAAINYLDWSLANAPAFNKWTSTNEKNNNGSIQAGKQVRKTILWSIGLYGFQSVYQHKMLGKIGDVELANYRKTSEKVKNIRGGHLMVNAKIKDFTIGIGVGKTTYNDHVTYKVQEQKDIVEAVSASYVVVNKNYIKDGKSTVLIKEKVDTTFASVNENKIAFEGKSSVQWLSIPFKLDYGIDINNTRSQLGLFIGGSLLIKPKVTGYDLSNTQWKDYTVSSDLKSLAWSANAGLRYGFFLNRRLQLNAAAMVNLNPKSIASNYTWINSSGSIQLGVVRYIR